MSKPLFLIAAVAGLMMLLSPPPPHPISYPHDATYLRAKADVHEFCEADFAALCGPEQLEAMKPPRRLTTVLMDVSVVDETAGDHAPGPEAARLGLGGDAGDLASRRETYGANYIEPPAMKTYWELILEGCEDNTVQALIICATVSLIMIVAEKPSHRFVASIEGVAIFLTVAVVLNLQASIEWTKAREFRRQQEELESDALVSVVRGGKPAEIAPRDIVVGDVVRVAVGDVIAADGILLEGTDVKMDESALTGEPVLVAKEADAARDPFVLSGTSVMTGSGKLLAVAVGINSVQGRIFAAVQGKADDGGGAKEAAKANEESAVKPEDVEATTDGDDDGGNLEEKMDGLAMDIGKAGLYVSTVAFVIMTVVYVSMPAKNLDGKSGVKIFGSIMRFFLVAVTILVVAVPEGLPLAVALCKAITIGKMMEDNNRVKHMNACETMGSATTICSDKTGTLTANRMTVRGACVAGCVLPAIDPRSGDADAAKPVGARILDAAQIPAALAAELGTLVAVCTMDESSVAPPEVAGGQAVFKGNPTECALLELAAGLGCDWRAVRESTAGRSEATRGQGHAFMFSSARKVMAWAVPRGDGFRVYVKGAAEIVLARCEAAATAEGSEPLDDERKERFYVQGVVKDFASDAMRTIALAYKDMPKPDAWEATSAATKNADGTDAYAAETGLTLLAVVGIEDPLRDEVPPAIARCYKAGIDVRMCTGDNLATAVAIASRCGILRDHHYVNMKASGDVTKLLPDRAMTGREFRRRVHKTDEATGEQVFVQAAFDEIWPRLRVMARWTPRTSTRSRTGSTSRSSSRTRRRAAGCARRRTSRSSRTARSSP
mmetsp:Transcript_20483/g.67649  ORF Transcript_20483/g.67649 Transcript_20483/m.67649 type:complete len:836 (-) Transcript_20483:807-3314(-)